MAMAMRMPKLFGEAGVKPPPGAVTQPPTTQMRLAAAAASQDPPASGSIMDQLRPSSTVRMPRRIPLIGKLPIVRQFQVLGTILVLFVVLAALMMFLDGRQAAQSAASSATATEMQMLSQRIARGAALASQGQTAAFAAVTDSRD